MHKPGYRTTEFWLTVAFDIAAITSAIANQLPPKWATLAGAIATSIYAAARAYTKANQPAAPQPAAQA